MILNKITTFEYSLKDFKEWINTQELNINFPTLPYRAQIGFFIDYFDKQYELEIGILSNKYGVLYKNNAKEYKLSYKLFNNDIKVICETGTIKGTQCELYAQAIVHIMFIINDYLKPF